VSHGVCPCPMPCSTVRRCPSQGARSCGASSRYIWLFSVRGRRSVLGRYGIDRFGDTTLRTYGIYRIRDGDLAWDRAVMAPR
jgi:hypothetical protein